MISNIKTQVVYNKDTKDGVQYIFNSKNREVRLTDILDALNVFVDRLSKQEKQMITDLCLMLQNTDEDIDPKFIKKELSFFTRGYLLGKYTVNTKMTIDAENVSILRQN